MLEFGLFRRRPKQLLICIYTLIFIITWFWPKQYANDLEEKPRSRFDSSTVHLAFSVNGDLCIRRLLTMFKSLLYYSGRIIRDNRSECHPTHGDTPQVRCDPRIQVPPLVPIHLHFLVFSNEARIMLTERLAEWKMTHIDWTMYTIDRSEIDWIPNIHRAGQPGLAKLLIPSYLPKTVGKVILMDSDMLLNANILELWNHFDNFNEKQSLGLAWEHQSEDPSCNAAFTGPIPNYGVNSGLVLLHLDRLHKLDWRQTWQKGVQSYLKRAPQLRQADQDIYNEVIRSNPELYYKLPCEWNIQLYSGMTLWCCPSRWPDRAPLTSNCRGPLSATDPEKRTRMAKLVHYNLAPKPEDPDFPSKIPSAIWETGAAMNRTIFLHRLAQAYEKFQSIPFSCFI